MNDNGLIVVLFREDPRCSRPPRRRRCHYLIVHRVIVIGFSHLLPISLMISQQLIWMKSTVSVIGVDAVVIS
jgi:hypothetical protein